MEKPEDIFFVDFGEAARAVSGQEGDGGTGDIRRLVAERRASYEWELGRRRIPRVLLSDGTEPEALHAAGAAGCRGHWRAAPRPQDPSPPPPG